MDNNSAIDYNRDSLDQARQQYSRVKSGYSSKGERQIANRPDVQLKNLYRQQLDQIMNQKNQQKRIEKQRDQQQRKLYNQRLTYGKQAERQKDLSYKNYYQLLLDNQNNLAKYHIDLNQQRDSKKEHLIQNSIIEEKQRTKQWEEAEQRRIDNIKRNYRQQLAGQLNQKNLKNAQDYESSVKEKAYFQKVTLTADEVAKRERERKLMQMSKYRQDLDRTSSKGNQKYRMMNGQRVLGGNSLHNDFNIFNQNRHDPMTNPLPYNIQNPYILKEFQRRSQGNPNDSGSYSPISQGKTIL